MAQAGYVDAVWVAAYEADLADGTHLIPGETVAEVPEGEANASDNWEPVSGQKQIKPPAAGDSGGAGKAPEGKPGGEQ